MAHQSDLIEKDILAYLKSHEEKTMLRFITCGSVDDGKSTLIGRLLWDSKMVFEDQLASLEADSKKVGTQGGAIDYALLMDGLQAEREQGITIDVAYRYFSTDRRKFIVADTPGHEQYTRNMVTGASTAQVAIILVDARKGLLTQTRRHSYLVSLVGIRNIVLAVNKMDLINFDRQQFEAIRQEYQQFAAPLGFGDITAIPLSALGGDNMIEASVNTPWYEGPTLLNYLESVRITGEDREKPFRMPIQWVNRPHLDFRGFCGTIASGVIRPGDELLVASSGRTSRVTRIVTMNGDLPEAVAGQSVTLTLADEIDISRGDMLSVPSAVPFCTRFLEANLVWLHDEALKPGQNYLIKTASSVIPGRVIAMKYVVDVNTLEQKQSSTLGLNEIGVGHLELDRPASFDPYRLNRDTGSFIIIDRISNATVAAGMFISADADSVEKKGTDRTLLAQTEDHGGTLLSVELARKYQSLKTILQEMEGVVIGFSGGVDSTLLFAVAADVLGEKALAVTATSATYPERELHEARELAASIDGRHREVVSEELDIPEFKDNPRNRCYFCKNELFGKLRQIANDEGLPHVLDGTNLDDRSDHRPGRQAAEELGVRSPLEEIGFTKVDIRTLSRHLGLPTWEKPAFACLSSRFPYGTAITAERVSQVGKAEDALRELGFRVVRVRYHDSVARLELGPEEFELACGPLRDKVSRLVKEAGFVYVALDLQGYRTGAMNEAN